MKFGLSHIASVLRLLPASRIQNYLNGQGFLEVKPLCWWANAGVDFNEIHTLEDARAAARAYKAKSLPIRELYSLHYFFDIGNQICRS